MSFPTSGYQPVGSTRPFVTANYVHAGDVLLTVEFTHHNFNEADTLTEVVEAALANLLTALNAEFGSGSVTLQPPVVRGERQGFA